MLHVWSTPGVARGSRTKCMLLVAPNMEALPPYSRELQEALLEELLELLETSNSSRGVGPVTISSTSGGARDSKHYGPSALA